MGINNELKKTPGSGSVKVQGTGTVVHRVPRYLMASPCGVTSLLRIRIQAETREPQAESLKLCDSATLRL